MELFRFPSDDYFLKAVFAICSCWSLWLKMCVTDGITCNQRHCLGLNYGWLSSRESVASTITILDNIIHQKNIVYTVIKYKYDMTVKFHEFLPYIFFISTIFFLILQYRPSCFCWPLSMKTVSNRSVKCSKGLLVRKTEGLGLLV